MSNAMKLFALALLALAASLPASAAETPNFTPYVGGNPTFGQKAAVIDGKKVTLIAITAFLHDMDLPPGGVQEFDGETKYFVKDGTGNLAHCEKWIKRIKADERAWTKKDGTYPYLEINVASNAKSLTWKGMTVYKGTDVRCWEAMDFGQPED
jgi:hypothetical protein